MDSHNCEIEAVKISVLGAGEAACSLDAAAKSLIAECVACWRVKETRRAGYRLDLYVENS